MDGYLKRMWSKRSRICDGRFIQPSPYSLSCTNESAGTNMDVSDILAAHEAKQCVQYLR